MSPAVASAIRSPIAGVATPGMTIAGVVPSSFTSRVPSDFLYTTVELVSSVIDPCTVRSTPEVTSTVRMRLSLIVYLTAAPTFRSAGSSTALCELNSVVPSSHLKDSTAPSAVLKVILLAAVSTL
ncbi:hypothetical protein D3C75_712760 [compost metagenome]